MKDLGFFFGLGSVAYAVSLSLSSIDEWWWWHQAVRAYEM